MKYSGKHSKSTPRSALEVEYSKKLSKSTYKSTQKVKLKKGLFFREYSKQLSRERLLIRLHTGCPKKVSDSDVVLIPSSAA